MILRSPGSPLNLVQVRLELRGTLVRELPAHRAMQVRYGKPGRFFFPDEQALALLRGLTVHFANDVVSAQRRYAAHRADGELMWAELLERDTIRQLGGRIWLSPPGLRDFNEKLTPALWELHKTRFNETYSVSSAVSRVHAFSKFAKELAAGDANPAEIGCQTPSWVAARLWEDVAGSATVRELYQWIDKWHAVGYPDVTPANVWPEEVADAFLDRAFGTLAADCRHRGGSAFVTTSSQLARQLPSTSQYCLLVPRENCSG